MTDNELLFAMSEMMDKKLEPVKKDLQIVKKVVSEHSEKLQKIG